MRNILILLCLIGLSGCYTKQRAIQKFCPAVSEKMDSTSKETTLISEKIIIPPSMVEISTPCPGDTIHHHDTTYIPFTKGKSGPCNYEIGFRAGRQQTKVWSDSVNSLNQIIYEKENSKSSQQKTVFVEKECPENYPGWLIKLVCSFAVIGVAGTVCALILLKRKFFTRK